MTYIVSQSEEETNRLYAIDTPFEFTVIKEYVPYYILSLVSNCKRRGYDANWFVPTSTMLLWLKARYATVVLDDWEKKYGYVA